MNDKELREMTIAYRIDDLITLAQKVGFNLASPLYDHGELLDKQNSAKQNLIAQINKFIANAPIVWREEAPRREVDRKIILTPNEFAESLLKFSDHPYIPEYRTVMDAYRAAVHYATWHQDEFGTWQCGSCEGEWIFDDGTPQENSVKFCPMCGAIIEAFCEWKWEDD